jgi:uncharacterized membrane protein YtjA (UPF0391 family)
MLKSVIAFFILAAFAAFLGFSGLAADFAGIAKLLTFLFIVLFVASLFYSMLTGRFYSMLTWRTANPLH